MEVVGYFVTWWLAGCSWEVGWDYIIAKGWNVAPLMVLVAGARGKTHIPSMKKIRNNVHNPYHEYQKHV